MQFRTTNATIAAVATASLLLLGLVVLALNVGHANAQLIGRGQSITAPPTISAPASETADRNVDRPPRPRALTEPSRGFSSPFLAPSPVSTPRIMVTVQEGPELSGEPVNLNALQINTAFGPVSIPLNQIAGIRTLDDPGRSFSVCLTNGDSLTGALASDAITIKTRWGSATIGRAHLVSIVTSTEPVNWQLQDGRWRLVPVEPAQSEAETEPMESQAGGTAPNPADSSPPPPLSFDFLPTPGG
jgi:hypothetical protein